MPVDLYSPLAVPLLRKLHTSISNGKHRFVDFRETWLKLEKLRHKPHIQLFHQTDK